MPHRRVSVLVALAAAGAVRVAAAEPRLLALGFSGESCGANCEDFSATHLFDLRDGREVPLGGLLTVEGFAAVGRRVDAERRRAYRKQLRELRAANGAAHTGDDDDDDDRIAFSQAVLRQEGDAPPPSGFGQRELHGQLAGMAITMTLGRLREGVQQRGSDAYDKYRTPIPLLASRDGNQVRAVEGSASAGSFDLTIAGGSLVGTWSDKEGRKRLPVILQ